MRGTKNPIHPRHFQGKSGFLLRLHFTGVVLQGLGRVRARRASRQTERSAGRWRRRGATRVVGQQGLGHAHLGPAQSVGQPGIERLGQALPSAIMAVLIVYCLKFRG